MWSQFTNTHSSIEANIDETALVADLSIRISTCHDRAQYTVLVHEEIVNQTRIVTHLQLFILPSQLA